MIKGQKLDYGVDRMIGDLIPQKVWHGMISGGSNLCSPLCWANKLVINADFQTLSLGQGT